MKRIVSFLLSLVLFVSLVPFEVLPKLPEVKAGTTGSLTYEIFDDEAIITGVNGNISGDLVIPSTIEDCPVTEIDPSVFKDCTAITSVIIPDSVKVIGNDAFKGCSGLSNVKIGKDATKIGDYAFYNCSSLESVTIPENVTSIGDYAFGGCTNLETVNFNATNCTKMGYRVFYNCNKLKTVNIGDNVTTIPSSAFEGCRDLTNLTIGKGVTSIGDSAFYDCTGLTSVTIPENVTSIGELAFGNCTYLETVNFNATNCTYMGGYEYHRVFYCCNKLKTVNIGDNVTNIPAYAFYMCEKLESITIPDSVKSIGRYAFYICSGLTSVKIGVGLENLDSYAFSGCKDLMSFTVEENNPNFCSTDGILFNKDKTELVRYPLGKSGSYIISDSVTKIGEAAFSGAINLTRVTIPNSVTEIGNGAFSGCSGLSRVSMGTGVTNIGASAFSGCSELMSIKLPDSVTSIGVSAFSGCSGLTSVTIPENVTTIGELAFGNCTYLETVNFNATNCTYMGDGYEYYRVFYNCNKLKTVNIGDNVTNIPAYAFYDCTGLTSVTIPDSVTSIVYNAFSGCSGLTSVTIPENVTSIGYFAFMDCTNLETVNFNATNCTKMGSSVFYDCNNFKTLNIGDNVTNIPDCAFYNCTGLTSVTIPDSVTSIGTHAFSGCTALTSVTIPENVTSIGDSAFGYCTNLETVNFNATNCTYMGGSWIDSVFYDCNKLKTVNIGDNVTNIPAYAFYDCYSIDDVYYQGTEEDRDNLSIGANNGSLTSATWHYNSCAGKENHVFDNSCDPECNDCGFIRNDAHSYDNSCDEICNDCGLVRVAPHVYDYPCDERCKECGEERTAESHKKTGETIIYSIANSNSYPFSLNEGVYSSTNKSDNSSSTATITALRNGSIKIEYKTSTESNYDKLIIEHNGTILVTKSGENSWESITIDAVAGDIITITYSKDGSQSDGNDEVYFKLSSTAFISTDDIDPTCEEGVVCDICGKEVKPAKGHSFSNDCDETCNDCDFTRVTSHDWNSKYSKNKNTHWIECLECGEKKEESTHDFGDDDICDICGYGTIISGDANGDGEIETSDAIEVLRSIAGYNTDMLEEAADFNGDGVVNTGDAILILRKIAGY